MAMSTMASSVHIQAKSRAPVKAVPPISQRLLFGLGFLEWILLLAPLYGCVGLLRDGLRVLPVRSIVVTGALQHVHPEDVRSIVTPFVGQGLLMTPIERVVQALSRHPWVEHAEVVRLWPNRLQIAIKERLATARWGGMFLDDQGRPFKVPPPWPDLPQLGGPEHSRDLVFQYFQALARQCRDAGLSLEALHLEAAAWRARVSGVEVLLGTQAPLADMTTYLRLVYPLVRAQQQLVEHIDLRYRGAFALRLKPPPSGQGNGTNLHQGQPVMRAMEAEGGTWQGRQGERLFPLHTGGTDGQKT